MVSYDFVLRFAPRLSEPARVRMGRGIMIGVLLLCSLLAPGIRHFHGVFGYLVQLWSLLAPPVFVCVVAGIFTRRASALGAMATLAIGVSLGAVTFWALRSPGIVAQMPVYLRSPLNCGFVITLLCSAIMAVFSLGGSDNQQSDEVTKARTDSSRDAMSRRERRIYHLALLGLAVLWLAIVVTFSPWGLATALPAR
jgi:SSS family solute:Na+ symporter